MESVKRPPLAAPVISIPQDELQFTYARSSGKGGQNVNKVNSKAVLKWNLTNSRAVSPAVKNRFIERFSSRLTTEGDVVIMSDEHRDQGRNVSECITRLKAMLASVWRAPKIRRATKPTFGSKQRRLKSKKEHGHKKSNRGKYRGD
jgi:ribosome-associated protein